jgi:serine/threonine-protein kinase
MVSPVHPDDVGRVSWGDGDVIVFIRGSSLWRTNSSGGPVTRLTTVDSVAGEGDTWPFVLPGGKAVLFNHYREARTADEVDVFVVRIADGVVKRLGIKGSNPRYVSSGHIVVPQSDGTLLAAPFDPETLEMRGPPVRVLEGLYVRPTGVAQLDVSRNGVLTYIEGGELQHPVIVDRAGVEHDVGFADGAYVHPRLSPNSDRVAVERSEGVRERIFGLPRERRDKRRPIDSRRKTVRRSGARRSRVAWIRADSVGASIRWQSADGSGAPEVIPTPGHVPFRFVFTPDGKSIVVAVGGPFRHDIWVFPLDGKSAPRALARTDADELQPSVSPDGRWLAFTSNETGRSEVFVLSMDDPSTPVQITTTARRSRHGAMRILIARGASFVSISLGFTPRIEVTR